MSDDRYDRMRYYNEDTFGIQSTAGAVPVRNKKGEVSMQKVKVQRYISGKRPVYAARRVESDSEDSDDEDFTTAKRRERRRRKRSTDGSAGEEGEDDRRPSDFAASELEDPRLKRLAAARRSKSPSDEDEDVKRRRRRRVHEAEILSEGGGPGKESEDGSSEEEEEEEEGGTQKMELDSDGTTSGEDDLDDEGIQRRRELMRQRAVARAQIGVGQEEMLAKEDEKSATEDEEESTEEEETTDSEEDGEGGARLKPVFVRKKDRLTVQEREREDARQKQVEHEAQKAAEARRRETLRMVETTVKTEMAERKVKADDPHGLHEVNTDDENEEAEYEAWKLRELKRMKRDRDQRDAGEREMQEVERVRNMTEDERRQELKSNPKQVTNKATKGKYKFMQKYYHRGAFFLEKEDNLLRRDYSGATLEDKFDKTVLPKVMQVKNFGRSGRTKYTHLVDQDTTQFDAAWSQDTAQNVKFQMQHAGGMKAKFERPSTKKK